MTTKATPFRSLRPSEPKRYFPTVCANAVK